MRRALALTLGDGPPLREPVARRTFWMTALTGLVTGLARTGTRSGRSPSRRPWPPRGSPRCALAVGAAAAGGAPPCGGRCPAGYQHVAVGEVAAQQAVRLVAAPLAAPSFTSSPFHQSSAWSGSRCGRCSRLVRQEAGGHVVLGRVPRSVGVVGHGLAVPVQPVHVRQEGLEAEVSPPRFVAPVHDAALQVDHVGGAQARLRSGCRGPENQMALCTISLPVVDRLGEVAMPSTPAWVMVRPGAALAQRRVAAVGVADAHSRFTSTSTRPLVALRGLAQPRSSRRGSPGSSMSAGTGGRCRRRSPRGWRSCCPGRPGGCSGLGGVSRRRSR